VMDNKDVEPTLDKAISSYVIGYVIAVVLTMLAYLAVVNHWFTDGSLIVFIVLLAIIQLLVQLVFFLHLGRQKDARLNIAAFLFMALVLFILVGGSLWIMYSLNYNMHMSPEEMDRYMHEQSSKGF